MIKGSIVALVSPMFEDGTIDYDSYRNLIEMHIAAHRNIFPVDWLSRRKPLEAVALLNKRLFVCEHFHRFAESIDELQRLQIPGATFMQADLEGAPWPFEDEVFDVIVVSFYLERSLFPERTKTLNPCRRFCV